MDSSNTKMEDHFKNENLHVFNHGFFSEFRFTLIAGILCGVLCAIIVAWLLYRLRQQRKKLKGLNHESPLTFQPPRRPTAVRSPSGAPPHYLKKSPSPTAPKPPPGSTLPGSNGGGGNGVIGNNGSSIGGCGGINSTNGNNVNSGLTLQPNQDLSPMGHHHTIKYSEENEMKPRTVCNELKTPELDSPDGATGDDDEYGKLGTIVFKLRYLTEKNALVVSIVRCRGLPGKPGPSGTGDIPTGMNGKTQTATDPYVKLQLLPEKQHKVKTRVVRNTRNPVYDEDFTFYGLDLQDLSTMSLHFVVLSFDRYSRDDVIGEVVCPLNTIELKQIENQQIALSKEIQPRSLKIRAQGRGDLLLSLCWQPAAARLTVVLLKARNLPRMDVTGLADPYVKIYLLYNGQRIAKKKTHVKKRTLSPVFNESFAFDIPTTEGSGASLDNVSLELMLLDWDRVTKNEVIGRLELGGPRCTGSALNHWNELCNLPRRQIAEWHKLHE
ncbi:synaptotagmin-4 [Condylostylus longicornis]|uniref:synaptotagmin-4 n=1 Tax=Condylostylus longicornis TaxID=2530218 RepID=UPI00244DEA3E|nr:synaptotagmin-4 [Condylostylus longicornis]